MLSFRIFRDLVNYTFLETLGPTESEKQCLHGCSMVYCIVLYCTVLYCCTVCQGGGKREGIGGVSVHSSI